MCVTLSMRAQSWAVSALVALAALAALATPLPETAAEPRARTGRDPCSAARPPRPGPAPHRGSRRRCRSPSRDRCSLVMGGDLLWHNTVWQRGRRTTTHRDGDRLRLRPDVRRAPAARRRAPTSRSATRRCRSRRRASRLQNYPVFAAPPEIAPWIACMGWDACTTASNHSCRPGLRRAGPHRRRCWSRAGVPHVGTFRTAARAPAAGHPDHRRRRPGRLVAGTYGLNGFLLPEGREWSVSMWDAPNLLAQARAARRAGADVVVVHLHGGTSTTTCPAPSRSRRPSG